MAMPRPKPERALRRLVSNLATLHGDDIAAILGELDARQRRVVESLLHEHAEYLADPVSAPEGQQDNFDAAALSPWLAQRLQARAGTAFAMTERARLALREVSARVRPKTTGRGAS
jgi:hypothetical protein